MDLPSEVEWEWMAIAEGEEVPLYNIIKLSDNSWMLDLMIDFNNSSRRNFSTELFHSIYYEGALTVDGTFYTHPADLENKDLHKGYLKRKKKSPNSPDYLDYLNEAKISGMSNNVSEWLRDSYSENWELMFQRQLKLWEQENTSESLFLRQIAMYYDSYADKDGHLVKGGSWLDERFSDVLGKNIAGIHAKTFVSPNKSHAALGFRYVIYFME